MTRITLVHERLSYSVIGAFFEVYYTLGFGFLEHVYVASLTRELMDRGHDVRREVSVPVLYKGDELYRVIASNSGTPVPKKNSFPRVPPLPRVPRNPSVGVAGRAERAPTSTSVSGAIPESEPSAN
jgi:hypothetical protein